MTAVPHAEITCEGTVSSVGAARAFVASTLTTWRATEYEWAAILVVSELATNAVLHARTDFEVRLTLDDEALTIEVRDGSVLTPTQRRYGTDSTTGRGMKLVADMCAGWTVDLISSGKIVRCSLPHDSRQHDPADDDDRPDEELDIDTLLAHFSDDTTGDTVTGDTVTGDTVTGEAGGPQAGCGKIAA